jgi:leucyl/phenylalanyl-tRNA--protein transferase
MAVIALERKYQGYIISKKAEEEGLVAIGGKLNKQTLIDAYSHGIFPWFTKGEPIMWWSPDPRYILIPEKFKVSHSLRNTLNKGKFKVTIDKAFTEVMVQCMNVSRAGQNGTWITEEMIKAYTSLHKAGLAHSFETWMDGSLVGGLYGVSLGKAFFGESMFHLESDASKVAFHALAAKANKEGFLFIDAQMHTEHLVSLGAEGIPRKEFLIALKNALEWPTLKGKWEIV